MDEYALEMEVDLRLKMLYYLFRNFIGFGTIDALINDRYLEDISCDGYNIPIYVFHMKYGGMRTNVKFTKNELDSIVMLLCQKSGKYISYANPLIDAALPDGSRLQASYGSEITPRGSSFTIRKFRTEPYTPIDLMSFGGFNSEMLAYFWLLVENKMNVMVIGETASGKTTTLNALTMFIPPEAKIISIEDTREIQLSHENWIAEVTRIGIEESGEITMYDLLRAALRQRPDYIIVGEVRGIEARTLFQAMSTGHSSYSTLHAGDMNQLVYRLENEPLNVPRIMIQFLDAVIVQSMWVKKGVRKRRAKEVNEVFGIDPVNKNLLVNPLYKWEPSTDSFIQVSQSKKLDKIAQISGEDVSEIIEEMERRRIFLEKMQSKGIRDHKEVTNLIGKYYKNPEKAMEEL
jgi:flagellar protein FlaI